MRCGRTNEQYLIQRRELTLASFADVFNLLVPPAMRACAMKCYTFTIRLISTILVRKRSLTFPLFPEPLHKILIIDSTDHKLSFQALESN